VLVRAVSAFPPGAGLDQGHSAAACQVVLFAPGGPPGLLPCLAVALPVWGTRRFLTRRGGGRPLITAMGFVVVTYLALVVRAVLLP
jgi:hypothetical protein